MELPRWIRQRLGVNALNGYRFLSEENPGPALIARGNAAFIHESATCSAKIDLGGSRNIIVIGAEASVAGFLHTRGTGGLIQIGSKVELRKVHINMPSRESRVSIGDRTYIGGAGLVTSEGQSITIGADCLLSSGITVSTSDSHGIYDRGTGDWLNPPGSVVIENNVWVGRGVAVQKGVTIGSGGVIAQRSTVTRDTERYSIYAGSPARLVRSEIIWNRQMVKQLDVEDLARFQGDQ